MFCIKHKCKYKKPKILTVENLGKFLIKISYNGIVVRQELVNLNEQPLWFYYGSVAKRFPQLVNEGLF